MRILFFITGIFVGFIFGYSLTLLWLAFKGYILGYGDTGPAWINKVTYLILFIGILIGIIASQWYYDYLHKKGRI